MLWHKRKRAAADHTLGAILASADGSDAVDHMRSRSQIAWKLSCDLGSDVAHRCQHADAAMLQLYKTVALGGCNVAISREAKRIPEAYRLLHIKLTNP